MSDSLWPHGLQYNRIPCPSLSPGVCSNSCPLSRWCHPTISSSVVPFSSCPQSFPTSVSFPMSQLFTSVSQSIGVSALVLTVNTQDWFSLGLTGLISLMSKGLSSWLSVLVWGTQTHKTTLKSAEPLSLSNITFCKTCSLSAFTYASNWQMPWDEKWHQKWGHLLGLFFSPEFWPSSPCYLGSSSMSSNRYGCSC